MIPLVAEQSDQKFGDAPRKPWYSNHIDLKEDLESLFNRDVNLVDGAAIKNPYFRKYVDIPVDKSMHHAPKSLPRNIQQTRILQI